MKQLVIKTEQIMINNTLRGLFGNSKTNKDLSKYKNVFFVSDDNFICDYLMSGVYANNNKVYDSVTYVNSGAKSQYRQNTLNEFEIPEITTDEFLKINTDNNLVFFFVDTTSLQSAQNTLSALQTVKTVLSKNKKSRCIVTALLPKIEYFPTEATSLAEREFNFFIEKECETTPEIDYYLQIEKICRGFVRDNDLNLTLLRFDNVFAPDRFHTPSFDLENLIYECVNSKEVKITDDDDKYVSTITYIRDAAYSVFHSAFKGVKGHTYNIAQHKKTKADIKRTIFSCFPEDFSISEKLSAKKFRKYNCLNCLVFSKLKIVNVSSFNIAMKHTVSYLSNNVNCHDYMSEMLKQC